MKSNRLGRTDLAVSEICLGTMTWGKQNSEVEAHAQIDYALEAGINFMDTAELYAVPATRDTYGKTEEIIGSYFANSGNRDQWILASKIAGANNPWIREKKPITGDTIREAIEGSLKRLQTDYIDLYQLHWPNRGHYHFENSWSFDPSGQNTEETLANMIEVLEVLDAVTREGKIRHVGLSNESAWGTMQYLRLAEEHDLPRVASIQNEYNLLRRYFDHDLAEVAHHENVGLLAYSPLAAGALTGKYLGNQLPEGTRGAIAGSVYRSNKLTEPAIKEYIAIADKHRLNVSQMALAFCLTRPFMTSVIVGATSMEQLQTDIGAADIRLTSDVMADIHEVFKRHARTL